MIDTPLKTERAPRIGAVMCLSEMPCVHTFVGPSPLEVTALHSYESYDALGYYKEIQVPTTRPSLHYSPTHVDGLCNQTHRHICPPLTHLYHFSVQIQRGRPNTSSMAPPIPLHTIHEPQRIPPDNRSLVRLAQWSKLQHHTGPAG